MNSMTAFGRGEATNGDLTVVVELRSVNHRFRDINIRAPKEYGALEPRINAFLRDRFERGRIDCTVRRTAREGLFGVTPDLHLAEASYRAMREIAKRLQRPEEEVSLAHVFAQPGVLTIEEYDLDVTHEWEVLEPALGGAIQHLLEMRAREGAALKRELQQMLGEFTRYRGQLEALAEGVHARLRARLEERLGFLLAEWVDANRLAQEAAILADKADISEELARLASHVDQFRDLFISKKPSGRKMEFLLQEMGREVNTIGSKAVEEDASRNVVEMKALLEKMREQSANVE